MFRVKTDICPKHHRLCSACLMSLKGRNRKETHVVLLHSMFPRPIHFQDTNPNERISSPSFFWKNNTNNGYYIASLFNLVSLSGNQSVRPLFSMTKPGWMNGEKVFAAWCKDISWKDPSIVHKSTYVHVLDGTICTYLLPIRATYYVIHIPNVFSTSVCLHCSEIISTTTTTTQAVKWLHEH